MTGECEFGAVGYTVELRRYEAQGQSGSGPSIIGPPATSPFGDPPTFRVHPEPNKFYAVEVARQPQLFDFANHEQDRTSSNFYASWADEGLRQTPTYTLPKPVWDRLRDTTLLYYRAVTSAQQDAWENVICTTPDADYASAHFIFVSEEMPPGLDDAKNLVLVRVVTEPQGATERVLTVVPVHYRETTGVNYETVTILPDGITIPVQEVF